jgi:hypothetical protein
MKNALTLTLHAFVGWLSCGAVIAIGRSLLSMPVTLIIHAALAPVIFALITLFYFRKFSHYSPIFVASFFLTFVMGLDFFVVALLIEKSFSMFASVIGTWIPFLSIFLATCLTGTRASKSRRSRSLRF